MQEASENPSLVRSAEEEEEDDNSVSASKPKGEKSETDLHGCVIDVKCDCGALKSKEENRDGEKVCRICHLSGDHPSESLEDLIQLGCGCKDDMGIAHRHCGEAWFKLKGNTFCEICGEAAENITGAGDSKFMEEWNETSDASGDNSDMRRGFFRGQPFCKFLMACLVLSFILPWFFHRSMF